MKITAVCQFLDHINIIIKLIEPGNNKKTLP